MKKKMNFWSIGLLVTLFCLYFIIDFTGDKKKSKSLRSTLVEIDTALVSKLEIEGVSQSIDLYKKENLWQLTLSNGKSVKAEATKVQQTIAALTTIKPDRMVSKSTAKWGEYQVDSTGTRVKVYEGSEQTLDIVLGKFGMAGQRAYYTFVRLFEDKEVYVAKNFMSFSVPMDPSSYRNQEVIKLHKDSLLAVTLNYPADSSVRLEQGGDLWLVNGQPTDSTNVATYIDGIRSLTGKEFMDEDASLLISPTMTAQFDMLNGSQIVINAYQQNGAWVYRSTGNPENYFTDQSIFDHVFQGVSAFQ